MSDGWRDVRWEPAKVEDAGSVRLPDGRLSAGDPWWASEGLPFVVDLPPGSYAVRVLVAERPDGLRENAGAELIVDAARPVARWELLRPRSAHQDGYRVEVGVGSFGAAAALEQGLHERLPDIGGTRAVSVEVDGGDLGSLVAFTVGPQHQVCRTWAGLASDDVTVRLVTDLGLLDLDPVAAPPDAPLTPRPVDPVDRMPPLPLLVLDAVVDEAESIRTMRHTGAVRPYGLALLAVDRVAEVVSSMVDDGLLEVDSTDDDGTRWYRPTAAGTALWEASSAVLDAYTDAEQSRGL